MEADQTGERIRLVNEYKVQTGQPLVGTSSLPFGYMVAKDEATGRKKVVKNPEEAPILDDLIQFCLRYQSKRKAVAYLQARHHVSLPYNTIHLLMSNTMLYGMYRGNPEYCEPYIDKATFDKLQEVTKRNIKANVAKNRVYLFAGLILCPKCGSRLAGAAHRCNKPNGRVYIYKKYRCANFRLHRRCDNCKVVSEAVLERLLLANIERFLATAKVESAKVTDAEGAKVHQYDIDDIHAQIDRLNYSWQTGKIRTVEQYESQYAELLEKLDLAEAERDTVVTKDFSKIDAILSAGWKDIYNALDEVHRRAFWRGFIRSIEINWTTDVKEIVRVNFF